MIGKPHPHPARARAPGKIILSGEHAVVYGRPALVLAINRYATADVAPAGSGVTIDLADMGATAAMTWPGLRARAEQVAGRYEAFLQGAEEIERVAADPIDLAAFAVNLFLRRFPGTAPGGLRVRLESTVPMGCGMGSSAAAAVALFRALAATFGQAMNSEELYACALEVEKLQHGRPSGVDPYISVHGGCLRFRNGRAEAKAAPPPAPLFLVHTGAPESTTGGCVMQVAQQVEGDATWNAFEKATGAQEQALAAGDREQQRQAMRENHRLLCRIGVVPERIRRFVRRVEEEGGAAKICGAGSVRGEAGGVVWVAGEAPPRSLCDEFGYTLLTVEPESEGVRILA